MKLIFHIAMLSLLLISCEKPADFFVPSPDPKLVILSNFTHNQPLEVTVTRSEPLLASDTSYVAISNAEVKVYEDETLLEVLEFVPRPSPDGLFFRAKKFRPEIGKVYTLTVKAPGLPMITAQNSIPEPVTISQYEIADVEASTTFQGGAVNYNYTLNLAFKDPQVKGNHYHLLLKQSKFAAAIGDGTPSSSYMEEPQLVEILSASNKLLSYHRGGYLISDLDRNGQTFRYRLRLQTSTKDSNEQLGQLHIELRTVSTDYHQFHTSIHNQRQSSGEPVDQPVIIYNNIQEGYGIFAGYSNVQDSISIVQ